MLAAGIAGGLALGVRGPMSAHAMDEFVVDDPDAWWPELLVADSTGAHDEQPHGVPDSYAWAEKAIVDVDGVPPDWQAFTAWGQIYEPASGNPDPAARVALRDMQVHALSDDGVWTALHEPSSISGAAYREDFAGDYSVPADIRKEGDGSQSVTVGSGYNFHFWPDRERVTIPAGLVGLVTSYAARLVPGHSGARLLAGCGGDYWITADAGWQADFSANGRFGVGRLRFVTDDWALRTMTDIDADTLRANPPTIPA